MSAGTVEKIQSLHYGISEGKVVLTVADDRGPLHKISLTFEEWREIIGVVPFMNEGEVKVINDHQQLR